MGAHDRGATRCGSACLPARLRCGGSGRRRLQQVVPITGTPFPIDATTPGQPPGQTLGRDGVAGGVPRSGQPSRCTMLSSCSPLASPVAYCVYILGWQHCLGSATGLPKRATTKRWRWCCGESRSNKDNAAVRALCSMLCGGPPAYLCGVCVAMITIALPVVLLWWILSLSLAAHSSVALACPHTRRVSMVPAHTRRRAWPVTRQATGAHLCGAMCVMHFLWGCAWD